MDDDVQVSGRTASTARFPFALQPQLLSGRDAGGNLDGDLTLLGDAPGAATGVARLRNGSTGPAALRARRRHREESLLTADLSLPTAKRADDGRAARRRARSAAVFARFRPRNLDGRFGASSGLFERNLEIVAEIGA